MSLSLLELIIAWTYHCLSLSLLDCTIAWAYHCLSLLLLELIHGLSKKKGHWKVNILVFKISRYLHWIRRFCLSVSSLSVFSLSISLFLSISLPYIFLYLSMYFAFCNISLLRIMNLCCESLLYACVLCRHFSICKDLIPDPFLRSGSTALVE